MAAWSISGTERTRPDFGRHATYVKLRRTCTRRFEKSTIRPPQRAHFAEPEPGERRDAEERGVLLDLGGASERLDLER